jgi:hypothetical protein
MAKRRHGGNRRGCEGKDCKDAGREEGAGRKRQIAKVRVETKGHCGVWRRQVRKCSRSLRHLPLNKADPPWPPRRPRGIRRVVRTRRPPLTPYDRWARARRSKVWSLEAGRKGGIRTASTAGRARIRQEAEPSGAQNAGSGRRLGDLTGGESPFCPFAVGASCPPGATQYYRPTCGFVPHPRWARGPLSIHTDRGTSYWSVQPEGREIIRNLALCLWVTGRTARA